MKCRSRLQKFNERATQREPSHTSANANAHTRANLTHTQLRQIFEHRHLRQRDCGRPTQTASRCVAWHWVWRGLISEFEAARHQCRILMPAYVLRDYPATEFARLFSLSPEREPQAPLRPACSWYKLPRARAACTWPVFVDVHSSNVSYWRSLWT